MAAAAKAAVGVLAAREEAAAVGLALAATRMAGAQVVEETTARTWAEERAAT